MAPRTPTGVGRMQDAPLVLPLHEVGCWQARAFSSLAGFDSPNYFEQCNVGVKGIDEGSQRRVAESRAPLVKQIECDQSAV